MPLLYAITLALLLRCMNAETIGKLYCMNAPTPLYGNHLSLQLNIAEYPLDEANQLNPLGDICFDLGLYSDKITAGFYNYGNFMQKYCYPRCTRELIYQVPICGDRRLPPIWTSTAPTTIASKVNCSDLGLASNVNETTMIMQRDQFTLTISTTEETLPTNDSYQALMAFPFTEVHLMSQEGMAANAYTSILAGFAQVNPNLTKVAAFRAITDGSKTVDFPQLFPTLQAMPNLETLKLFGLSIGDTIPEITKNPDRITGLHIEGNGIKTIPTWLETLPNLQLLVLREPQLDTTFVGNLDLPSLEHFYLMKTNITTLPPSFLPSSSSLLGLDLSCNMLSSLPDSFLSSFPNLRFLSLGGNQFKSLSPTLLNPVPLLNYFDISGDFVSTTNEQNTVISSMGTTQACRLGQKTSGSDITSLDANFFSENTQLLALNLDRNKMPIPQNYFDNLRQMLVLQLGGMGLETVNNIGIANMCGLQYLDLSHNNFQNTSFIEVDVGVKLPMLQDMVLEQSNITLMAPVMGLVALTDEVVQVTITQYIQQNPVSNLTCEMSAFNSMIMGRPSPSNPANCSTRVTQLLNDFLPYRTQKFGFTACSPTNVVCPLVQSVSSLMVVILVVLSS